MIDRVKNSQQYLYHYTSSDTARKIIQSGKLRLGRYTNTNDLKEAKLWHLNFGTNRGQGALEGCTSEVSLRVSSYIKHGARLLCFSQDEAGLSGDPFQDIFSRGYAKPRMWAQYAEKHTGVCLVFDRNKLDQKIRKQQPDGTVILEGPVQYKNTPVLPDLRRKDPFMINADVLADAGEEEHAKIHVSWFFKELFFEKMLDWGNEAEYRWVVFDDSDEDKFIDFGAALAGIVYGDGTHTEFMDEFMELTENKSVAHLGLKWKNSSPWYDYGNLRLNRALRNSPWGQLAR